VTAPRFRIGRLDHVHIRVPDRAEAARWYAEHLGFEPVERFDFWAAAVDGALKKNSNPLNHSPPSRD